MPYVVAGLILVGVMCLLDLLLTFGVVRRLREHTERLDGLPTFASADSASQSGLKDSPLPEFSATARDGATVTTEMLRGRPHLIGFFSAGCSACHDRLPEFVALANQAESHAALAVVSGTGTDATRLIENLGNRPIIVAGPDAAAVVDKLGINLFPTFLAVSPEGTVLEAGPSTSTQSFLDATLAAGSR
ncbi:TlpA family protein disulfide reductase [Kribbella catacumbae]|uniref:TlpA family protein disulfide reductase n=1 Tax=Kribbella catacumbae TaxID=460086 RepID=UPI000376AE52|nr:redoxin family protein [Kribbella catacumbae]